MHVALISDTHFGVRGDSPVFHRHFEKFYNDFFFPYLDEHGIKEIIHLGDLTDRDKGISTVSLEVMNRLWTENIVDRNIRVHMLVGNHDIPYKNSNALNAQTELGLHNHGHVVISVPWELSLHGTEILMLPWITPENYEETMRMVAESRARVCMGHFEFAGFSMYKGYEARKGLSTKEFKKFDMVLSGHYHEPSKKGNIQYLGAPYEMTWMDAGCWRGFYILDTDSLALTPVRNPYTAFERIEYDEDDAKVDIDQLTDKFVRVTTKKAENRAKLDKFMNYVGKYAHNVQVTDNEPDVRVIDDIIEENQELMENTLQIIEKYVDSIEDSNIDKEKVKETLKEIYVESLKEEE